MNVKNYSTKDLEFITSHYEELKKELEKRKIMKIKFVFDIDDVIYSKSENNNSFFFLKIKDIDKKNDNIVTDEIVVSAGGDFDWYIDELFDYSSDNWNEWDKVENPEIFTNLASIISQYNEKVNKLNDETYQSLTQLIENEL